MSEIDQLRQRLATARKQLIDVLQEVDVRFWNRKYDEALRSIETVKAMIYRIRDLENVNKADDKNKQVPVVGLRGKARAEAMKRNGKLRSRTPSKAESDAIFPSAGSVQGVNTGQTRKPGSHRS